MPLVGWRASQAAAGLARATIGKRVALLRGFSDGVADPLAASPADVLDFLAGRRLAARSRYKAISDLHRFYVWAIAEGLCVADPTLRVPRPRLPQRLPRPMAETDLAFALTVCADPLLRAHLLLAGMAGLRCCELAGLRWVDLDLEAGWCRVMGKGSRERVVPLHPVVVASLRDLPRSDIYLEERPPSPAAVSHRINRFLRSHGIAATAHQLRHRAATAAYQATGDLLAVKDLLGHSSVATTQIYTAVAPAAVRRAVMAIPVP